ncbi:SsgA family sporulation/cell division regulator [Streptomyces exfoliatus]|uniref:SsgA family sporulation/cell division regulator n=1 Tax=Streptomyces exfoliatus TaxID=1905 RepID=UPI003C2E38E4
MEVIGGPDLRIAIQVFMRYGIGDPYAVHLDIHTSPGGPVTWFFARDLLLAGLHRRSGLGDVVVDPGTGHSAGHLSISLTGVDATAALRVSAAAIRRFLQQTEHVVPAGTEGEHLDIDAFINQLLGHSAA